MTTIAIRNHSTAISDAQLAVALPDLQQQLDRDFQPAWGYAAVLKLGDYPLSADLLLVISDHAPAADAGDLGFHLEDAGVPSVEIFAADCAAGHDAQSGLDEITVCISHELLELLADRYCATLALTAQGTLVALEVADPVEDSRYGYRIGNTLVSDFVTPEYFCSDLHGVKGTRFDFCGKVTYPFQMLPGGYLSSYDPEQYQWRDLTEGGEPVTPPVKSDRNAQRHKAQGTGR